MRLGFPLMCKRGRLGRRTELRRRDRRALKAWGWERGGARVGLSGGRSRVERSEQRPWNVWPLGPDER